MLAVSSTPHGRVRSAIETGIGHGIRERRRMIGDPAGEVGEAVSKTVRDLVKDIQPLEWK